MSEAITDQAQALMRTRLHQVDHEKSRLERALEALGSDGRNGNGKPATRRGPGRPRGKRVAGGRSAQAVKMIAAKPGITASEIARQMKIKPNYLYRILTDLEKQKKVKKDGRHYTAK